MDNTCEVVRDLLPLYVDGVCSEASRALADEHVRTCWSCADTLAKLRNSACEDSLRQERAEVLSPRKWRNRAFAVSCMLAAFLCVPACLTAVILSGREDGSLDWLYLLAPSLLTVASATLLPLRCRRYTGRWTLLGYTASLLLLLMACGLYAGGHWLFTAPVLALYVLSAAVIVPWAVRELPLEGRFGEKHALAVLAWIGFFALLIAIWMGLMAPMPHKAAIALGAAGLGLVTAGIAVLLALRLPLPGLARAGVCTALAGNAIGWLEEAFLKLSGAEANVLLWSQRTRIAILILTTAAGAALVAAGAWQSWRRDRRRDG